MKVPSAGMSLTTLLGCGTIGAGRERLASPSAVAAAATTATTPFGRRLGRRLDGQRPVGGRLLDGEDAPFAWYATQLMGSLVRKGDVRAGDDIVDDTGDIDLAWLGEGQYA